MIFLEWETIKSRCCASCKSLDIGGYCQHHGKTVKEIIIISHMTTHATIDCRYKVKI